MSRTAIKNIGGGVCDEKVLVARGVGVGQTLLGAPGFSIPAVRSHALHMTDVLGQGP